MIFFGQKCDMGNAVNISESMWNVLVNAIIIWGYMYSTAYTLHVQTSSCWLPFSEMTVWKVEQHSYVKKAVLCHRNAQEYHAELQEAVGDHTLP